MEHVSSTSSPLKNLLWYLLESKFIYLTSGPPVPHVKTHLEHAHKMSDSCPSVVGYGLFDTDFSPSDSFSLYSDKSQVIYQPIQKHQWVPISQLSAAVDLPW